MHPYYFFLGTAYDKAGIQAALKDKSKSWSVGDGSESTAKEELNFAHGGDVESGTDFNEASQYNRRLPDYGTRDDSGAPIIESGVGMPPWSATSPTEQTSLGEYQFITVYLIFKSAI